MLSYPIYQSLSIITFSLDVNYRYLAFSKMHFDTMKMIWGVEIAINSCMLDLIQECDKSKAKANFDRALKGESFTLIEEYGDINLKRYFWEDKYSPIVINNDITGLTVTAIEITQYVELYKKFELTQNRLNLALESSKIGVWEWDLTLDKIYWSDYMYDIFEIDTNTKLKFDTYLSLLHPQDKENIFRIVEKSITEKKDYEVTHRLLLKDGSLKWVLGKAKVVLNFNGDVKQVIGTCLDITKSKK